MRSARYRQCAVLAVLAVVLLGGIRRAGAIEELETEEDISDLLPQRFLSATQAQNPARRQWAVLPEFGYGPDTGPLLGGKFTHRNLFGSETVADAEATFALNEQQSYSLLVAQPDLADGHLLLALRAKYNLDPERRFFGLGNNDQGPAPASVHEFQEAFGGLTLGWRPYPRLALNFTVALRNVRIRHGERLDGCEETDQQGNIVTLSPCPFTGDAFPDLPGVNGGEANRLALSLVWNGRDDIVRPTRGWRAILKVIHTNRALASDFQFTRYIADLGYLRALSHGRYVAGLRVDGEWIEAPPGDVPFWELAELGGEDTMRGFFPYRFLGKGRALMNGELRFLLTQFDFYKLWHVKLDGVVFGDGGRVFIDNSDLQDEFKLNSGLLSRIVSDFQYSYGGGVRIALGEALVARIDAGFSNEEIGLVYLSFGQTF
jgi:outer membrane protein assembly factor BamA